MLSISGTKNDNLSTFGVTKKIYTSNEKVYYYKEVKQKVVIQSSTSLL